jgi:hypothetical protein
MPQRYAELLLHRARLASVAASGMRKVRLFCTDRMCKKVDRARTVWRSAYACVASCAACATQVGVDTLAQATLVRPSSLVHTQATRSALAAEATQKCAANTGASREASAAASSAAAAPSSGGCAEKVAHVSCCVRCPGMHARWRCSRARTGRLAAGTRAERSGDHARANSAHARDACRGCSPAQRKATFRRRNAVAVRQYPASQARRQALAWLRTSLRAPQMRT